MKKRTLIMAGFLLLVSSIHAITHETRVVDNVTQEVQKDEKTKYDERKKWIKDRKNELISLCNELVNMNDFPKTNIEKERDKLKLRLRMYLKEINDVDYANDKKFEAIQKKFDSFESYFRDYTLKLRERENMRRINKVAGVNTQNVIL